MSNPNFEVNKEYKNSDRNGYVVIPSHRKVGHDGPDNSGLSMADFDPTKPGPQIIMDENGKPMSVHNPTPTKPPVKLNGNISAIKQNTTQTDPAQSRPPFQEPAKPAAAPEPKAKVCLHVPGIKLSYFYHEVIILPEQNTLALVSDLRCKPKDLPQFEPTEDGQQIVLSIPDQKILLYCQYFGQQMCILDTIELTILVIESMQEMD